MCGRRRRQRRYKYKVKPTKANPEPQLAESWQLPATNEDESSKRHSTMSAFGLEEIIAIENESILNRADVRRSKSRVRTYLKKCKDAIIGNGTTSDAAANDHQHEQIHRRQRATSSWYVNEMPTLSHDAERMPSSCESEANVVAESAKEAKEEEEEEVGATAEIRLCITTAMVNGCSSNNDGGGGGNAISNEADIDTSHSTPNGANDDSVQVSF